VNFRQPPKLADWLLKYLRVNTGNEPLVGDLLEEFRGGRTAGWYWRQTFMAIVAEFRKRFRTYRQYFRYLFLGWCAESSVVVALWFFHVPFGVRSLELGSSALAIIWIALYIEYRIRVHRWVNDDSSDEESDQLWDRNISPRLGVLVCFVWFVANDVIAALLSMLPGTNYSLPFIAMCHCCWLCWATIGRLRRAS
jgi:hypothetical protein